MYSLGTVGHDFHNTVPCAQRSKFCIGNDGFFFMLDDRIFIAGYRENKMFFVLRSIECLQDGNGRRIARSEAYQNREAAEPARDKMFIEVRRKTIQIFNALG